MRRLVLAFALLTTAASAQIETPTVDELASLDAFADSIMADRNIPGVLVALASHGEVVVSRSYGLADVELAVPVSARSVFEIGSISKQFVSAAVMLLVEEGKLRLDDPIQEHLPEIPSEWYGATVRQLLTHTSGIPDYEEIRSYDVYRFRLLPEEVYAIAHSRPMDFAPGTGWYYSNTGYVLLSRIVERIEGRPLGQVLAARVFEPLGMAHTRLADPEAIIPDRASGYWVDRTGALINRPPTETSSTLGAGGLVSTAADLARWDAALDGDAFLSAASKAEMWTPARLLDGTQPRRASGEPVLYGFGWDLTPYRGLRTERHSGQVAGFTAYFARFPDQDAAVIVFLNRYQASAWPLIERALDTFVPGLDPAD